MGTPDVAMVARIARPSRNQQVRPGYDFLDGIALPGWEEQSIWGYDTGAGSFYAQLRRNGSRSDAPEVNIMPARGSYPWPGCVALAVVEATRIVPAVVVAALGIADPAPRLRPVGEIAAKANAVAEELRDAPQPTPGEWSPQPYLQGQVLAFAWTLGQYATCPGTGWAWRGGPPDAVQVDAELHMVTGRTYRRGRAESTCSGAGEALSWALGRRVL